MALNNVQSVAITKAGAVVFQFVCYDSFEQGAYLASQIVDALTHHHGGEDWDYEVTPLPYVKSITPDAEILHLALSKVVV